MRGDLEMHRKTIKECEDAVIENQKIRVEHQHALEKHENAVRSLDERINSHSQKVTLCLTSHSDATRTCLN